MIGVIARDQNLPENPFFGGRPSEEKETQWYGANAYRVLIEKAGFCKIVKEAQDE